MKKRERRPRPRSEADGPLLSSAEKRALIRALKDRPCAECGRSFPTEAMDFDHVRGRKKFTISGGGKHTLAEMLSEVAKCEVVCACCHRVRTTSRARAGNNRS